MRHETYRPAECCMLLSMLWRKWDEKQYLVTRALAPKLVRMYMSMRSIVLYRNIHIYNVEQKAWSSICKVETSLWRKFREGKPLGGGQVLSSHVMSNRTG